MDWRSESGRAESEHSFARRSDRDRDGPISSNGRGGRGRGRGGRDRSRAGRGPADEGRSNGSTADATGDVSDRHPYVGRQFRARVVAVEPGPPVLLHVAVELPDEPGAGRGEIRGFRLNRKAGRAFAAQDLIDVICTERLDNECMVLCPTSDYVVPLLILDVNGVLGARESFEGHRKHRAFRVRGGAMSFVAAMTSQFEVALWTCSRRQTLDDDVRAMRGQLGEAAAASYLFMWSQDEATNLWPRTSVVAPQKPLFLKELAAVWTAFPCYGPTNTVLVDNHSEKFERNPAYTCLVIPEYTPDNDDDDDDDDVTGLALNGELAQLLGEIARADDSQLYLRERGIQTVGATDAAYASTAGRAPSSSTSDRAPSSSTADRAPSSSTAGHRAPSDVVLQLLRLTRHPLEVKQYTERGEMPATVRPAVRTLRRAVLAAVLRSPCYLLSASSGARCTVLATTGGEFLILSEDLAAVSERTVAEPLRAFLVSRPGCTVLECSLVKDLRTAGDTLIVLDAALVDGNPVGLEKGLLRRLAAAEQWLEELLLGAAPPLDIIIAAYSKLCDAAAVRGRLVEGAHGWVYSDVSSCHACDGLVLTSSQSSFYHREILHWRPPSLLSVCLSVTAADMTSPAATIAAHCFIDDRNPSAPVCEIAVRRAENWVAGALTRARGLRPSDRMVLECFFDAAAGVWRAERDRVDRTAPDNARVVFSVLETAAEALGADEITGALATAQVGAGGDNSSSADPADDVTSYSLQWGKGVRVTAAASDATSARDTLVESHYDRLQRERWSSRGGGGGLDENIAVLRKFQNWNKACMIKTMMRPAPPLDLDAALNALNVAFAVNAISALQTPLNKQPPKSKQSSRVPLRVLDLACGRGGDLSKWTRDSLISLYVGVDISAFELKEAAERSRSLDRGRGVYLFHKSSCDSPSLLADLYEAVAQNANAVLDSRAHKERLLTGFNVVWCQFALHYFCESRDSLLAFMRNAATALCRGGRFCASFPNPFAIISHMNLIAQNGSGRSGSQVCYISRDSREQVTIEEGLLEFGLAYKFTLGDAVQQCGEFVVPLRALVSIASDLGLRLVRLLSMHDFMSKCAREEDMAALREVMQLTGPRSHGRKLSLDEWDAIGLYCLVVFEKI